LFLQAILLNHIDIGLVLIDNLDCYSPDESQSMILSTANQWLPQINHENNFQILLEQLNSENILKIGYLCLEHPFDDTRPWLYDKLYNQILRQPNTQKTHPLTSYENTHPKALLLFKLEKYIYSVEQHQRPSFIFFKERQMKNRQINCELAKKLKHNLFSQNISDAFANIEQQRDAIRQSQSNPPWFNLIASQELNNIIKLARSYSPYFKKTPKIGSPFY
jgi:hypothetical protein